MSWLAPSRVRVSACRVGSLLAPLTGSCRPSYDWALLLTVWFACPRGWGSLPVGSCLPAGWGSLLVPWLGLAARHMWLYRAGTLFPFAVRDMYRCATCTRSGSCLYSDLSPFTTRLYISLLSLGVYRGVFLLSGYAYTQGISPLGKKRLCTTVKIGRISQ